jgi:small subunit ribosomal protein S1
MEDNTSATPNSLEELKRKTHFTGKIVKITLAGAIVDIGSSVPGVIHISQIQKDSVNRIEDVLQVGQPVDVWVRRVYPSKQRIELTMIKPLDLEWREIKKDMVVKGKVNRLESWGVFVDIGAERPGLVHISELTHDYIRTPGEVVNEGDEVEVKVLDINRQKKQIKLSMKALEIIPAKPVKSSPKESKETKETKETAEPEKEQPIPTAMEMALRQAMERSKSNEVIPVSRSKHKLPRSKENLEKILARTLESKVHSNPK